MTGKLRKDLILIAAILVIGFSILFIRHGNNVENNNNIFAEITSSHGTHIVYLHDDTVFELPHMPHVTFEVREGQIAFVKSDCPDQICVRTGFLSRPGQMAACLPNSLILVMKNRIANDDDLDIFVR